MKSFWDNLPKPFTILAPMEDVTDFVFRQIITEIGKPDVLFTEFVSCDGLMSKGREKVEESLKFSKNEQPIVAQIWGLSSETFLESAKYCKELGFSGIDINMGCPDRGIVRRGSCAGLIKNPSLAKEIIAATKEGAEGLPVSVKTRIGFDSSKSDEWLGFLLEQDLAALTVHLRTVGEMSKVPAHWEYLPKILETRNSISPNTLIIGNGDIKSIEEVDEKGKEFGADGSMIGRGIFTNPWMFNRKINIADITILKRLELYLHHIDLFLATWGNSKNPAILKKFSKTYINNFPDASSLRDKVVEAENLQGMIEILKEYKARS